MPIKQLQLQCPSCDAVMPHNQPAPNHVVHALVSIFLIGLWIPVWILIAIGSGKDPATCVKCGTRRLPTGPAVSLGTVAPAKPTSQKQLVVMLAVMAVVVAGLLIYDGLSSGDWNQ
jgi:hypothetical protein